MAEIGELDVVRLPDGREGTVVFEYGSERVEVEIIDHSGHTTDIVDAARADCTLVWKSPHTPVHDPSSSARVQKEERERD